MRAALYARVSTADQKTLPLQLGSMREYAEHRGWDIALEVEEVGSGAQKRPQRARLMKEAKQRTVDAIVVWKLDRWGRSVPDLISSLNELEQIGVRFVSITEALDLTTSSGRAMAGLLAVFAEFERDLLRERVRAGLDQARRKGKTLGRPRTAMAQASRIEELHRRNLSKSEIARRLGIDRRSVRRILQANEIDSEE